MRPHPTLALIAVLAACGGAGADPARLRPSPAEGLRAEGARIGGGGDLLCAELLLAAGRHAPGPLHPPAAIADPVLAEQIAFLAVGHLRSQGLGAGTGAELAGSRRIQRLALEPNAEPDHNGNGRNWDEVLAAERARIVAHAGAVPQAATWQTFLPWQQGSTALAQPLPPSAIDHPEGWRTDRTGLSAHFTMADVGAAMTARVIAAGVLLREARGAAFGATADEGRLGLELLHQALAAEETLLGSLFTNGGPPGALADPVHYDPRHGASWLPTSVAAELDPRLPGAPVAYRILDGSSDLLALARLLQAAAELAWLASDQDPHPALRELFRGRPFGTPNRDPTPTGLSWDLDIGPLTLFRCGGCHLGFGEGGFRIDTYQTMLEGGTRTRRFNLPMVVPFDHQASMLWRIVTAPPPPFASMPLGAPLPQAEIQRIADWIDQGAVEHPVTIPPPPLPGEVLAAVLFRNLIALHLDRSNGALHHRHEGNAGSGIATATATGVALQALALLARALPDLEHDGLRPTDVLTQAGAFAAAMLVEADGRIRDDLHLTATTRGPHAHLAGHVALAAGLWATVPFSTLASPVGFAAASVDARLRGPLLEPATGLFREAEGHTGARLAATTLADLLASLRLAAEHGQTEPRDARDRLLAQLRPVLAPSEWSGRGEILDDGIPDTDGNGVPEPGAAGGPHGHLPLLGRTLLHGVAADRPPADGQITWTRHVRPLFEARCAQCHMHGNALGNYRLDTVELLRLSGDSGGALPLVVPGDPERSLLFRKLKDRTPPFGVQMPQQLPPLDDKGLELVRGWILAGALPL